jgi:hypothetical protein
MTIPIFEDYQLILEASVGDIYEKFYSDIKKEDFLLIAEADPTSNLPSRVGKYTKWIIKVLRRDMYAEIDPETDGVLDILSPLQKEDLYKFTDDLEWFDGNKHILKKNNKNIDINSYKSSLDLYELVEPFRRGDVELVEFTTGSIRDRGGVLLYSDRDWIVIEASTQQAATYYGSGTRWCTVAKNSKYYKTYSNKGPLYININKDTQEKYQFHFPTKQFMDALDNSINLPRMLDRYPGLEKFYWKLTGGVIGGISLESVDEIVSGFNNNNTIIARITRMVDPYINYDHYIDEGEEPSWEEMIKGDRDGLSKFVEDRGGFQQNEHRIMESWRTLYDKTVSKILMEDLVIQYGKQQGVSRPEDFKIDRNGNYFYNVSEQESIKNHILSLVSMKSKATHRDYNKDIKVNNREFLELLKIEL